MGHVARASGRRTIRKPAKSAGADIYLEVRADIVDAAQVVNQKGSKDFWNMALYWYIGDLIKSGGGVLDCPAYDDISHKELSRGQKRTERVQHRTVRNIIKLARSRAENAKPRNLLIMVWLVAYLGKYFLFKILNLKKGRSRRRILRNLARECPDDFIAYGISMIPVCYIEDFDFYYAITIDAKGPVDTRSLKGGYSISYSSRVDKGLPTRLAQHGGFTGEIKNSKGTEIEARIPTYYYTWGWRYSDNHIPHEPRRLVRFKSKIDDKLKRTQILLVLPTHLDESVIEKTKKIYCGLLSSCAELGFDLTIRPRPPKIENKRNELLSDLKKAFGEGASIDLSSDVTDSISRSALVLCVAHPATIFLECMYAGEPVIALSDQRYEYHENYKSWVNLLHNKGVLFFEVDDLVDQVNRSLNSIETMWSDIENDLGIREYKKNYCGVVHGAEVTDC